MMDETEVKDQTLGFIWMREQPRESQWNPFEVRAGSKQLIIPVIQDEEILWTQFLDWIVGEIQRTHINLKVLFPCNGDGRPV